ncbi:hypothetical protein DY78_GL000089 [Lactiplantibacillus fabifermentans DSM 21115]|uniref:Uncharacterized protein n=1 Tax=Lactiplantibacillus fabifermentans DSM 21115 TaxID=1413187 RepID=A0A0R2NRI2_9LACO|nr:hypothetical protein DY78_GL000089 [Lactiplantibacillus fabifermentans DSM 21115]
MSRLSIALINLWARCQYGVPLTFSTNQIIEIKRHARLYWRWLDTYLVLSLIVAAATSKWFQAGLWPILALDLVVILASIMQTYRTQLKPLFASMGLRLAFRRVWINWLCLALASAIFLELFSLFINVGWQNQPVHAVFQPFSWWQTAGYFIATLIFYIGYDCYHHFHQPSH